MIERLITEQELRLDVKVELDIIDQIENGYGEEVSQGTIPRYTCTPYIITKEGVSEFGRSYDTEQEALEGAYNVLKWTKSISELNL